LRISPSRFSGSGEKRRVQSEERREENRQIYERELPGKGGQLEPRHYNDWLAEANSPSAIAAPANSPLSLCVFVCRPMMWSAGTHAHVHGARLGKLRVAAGRSNL